MSTNCEKCNVSVFKYPLRRVSPIGEIGVFWCDKCIEQNEPELHKNIKEDLSNAEKCLEEIIYKL